MKPRNEKGEFIKGVHYSPETEFKKGNHWREPKPYWDKNILEDLYITQKKSAQEIANMFNCKGNNILYFLHKHKIPVRNTSESRQIKYWGLKGELNGMFGMNGELNPNWKGGLTPERQDFYISQEWKEVSQLIWKRDKGICQRCNRKKDEGIPFHIHHIISFQNKELRAIPKNLILICEICHIYIHSKENYEQQFIGEEWFVEKEQYL